MWWEKIGRTGASFVGQNKNREITCQLTAMSKTDLGNLFTRGVRFWKSLIIAKSFIYIYIKFKYWETESKQTLKDLWRTHLGKHFSFPFSWPLLYSKLFPLPLMSASYTQSLQWCSVCMSKLLWSAYSSFSAAHSLSLFLFWHGFSADCSSFRNVCSAMKLFLFWP